LPFTILYHLCLNANSSASPSSRWTWVQVWSNFVSNWGLELFAARTLAYINSKKPPRLLFFSHLLCSTVCPMPFASRRLRPLVQDLALHRRRSTTSVLRTAFELVVRASTPARTSTVAPGVATLIHHYSSSSTVLVRRPPIDEDFAVRSAREVILKPPTTKLLQDRGAYRHVHGKVDAITEFNLSSSPPSLHGSMSWCRLRRSATGWACPHETSSSLSSCLVSSRHIRRHHPLFALHENTSTYVANLLLVSFCILIIFYDL
jgi:hypothetical protein